VIIPAIPATARRRDQRERRGLSAWWNCGTLSA